MIYQQIFIGSEQPNCYSLTETAQVLRVTNQTLHSYKNIAKIHVPDFGLAIKAAKKVKPTARLAFINDYQVWVLAKIQGLFNQLKRRELVLIELQTNKLFYTYEAFKYEQKQGAKQHSNQAETCTGIKLVS